LIRILNLIKVNGRVYLDVLIDKCSFSFCSSIISKLKNQQKDKYNRTRHEKWMKKKKKEAEKKEEEKKWKSY